MVSALLPVYVRDELGGPAIAVALSFSGLSIAQIIADSLDLSLPHFPGVLA